MLLTATPGGTRLLLRHGTTPTSSLPTLFTITALRAGACSVPRSSTRPFRSAPHPLAKAETEGAADRHPQEGITKPPVESHTRGPTMPTLVGLRVLRSRPNRPSLSRARSQGFAWPTAIHGGTKSPPHHESGAYYVSADAFYNNGATSGSLIGTPFVDSAVPDCTSSTTPHPAGETTGGPAQTWANYSHAGAAEGPTIPAFTTVSVSCRVTGFRVADGDTWWYLVSSAPWNNVFYVSADPFYNNGETSGSLSGTPFVDPSVPICSGNTEAPIYSTAVGSSSATNHSTSCVSGDPVDCASGDFWQTFTDVSVPGREPGLDLTRTYNDLAAPTAGLFGNGWSSSYDQHLTLGGRDGSILVSLSDGSQMIAEPNGSGGFTLPPSTDDSLARNAGGKLAH